METNLNKETIKKTLSVYLTLDYFERLKKLCYDGKTTSRIASEIIMNFVDNCCESNKINKL